MRTGPVVDELDCLGDDDPPGGVTALPPQAVTDDDLGGELRNGHRRPVERPRVAEALDDLREDVDLRAGVTDGDSARGEIGGRGGVAVGGAVAGSVGPARISPTADHGRPEVQEGVVRQ